jgi:hypothetical protein
MFWGWFSGSGLGFQVQRLGFAVLSLGFGDSHALGTSGPNPS